MSRVTLSYTDAIRGIVNAEDVEGLLGLVENHKNWGAFSAKMPSYIVVSLVDAIKRLKEEASGTDDEKVEVLDLEDFAADDDDTAPF
jgi:hypothetical protein